jgi:hypothetical protein
MAVNNGELERSESSVFTPYTDHVSISSLQSRPKLNSWSCAYLVRIPAAFDIRVQLRDERCQTLGPRLAQAALVQEEVHTQVGLANLGLVVDGEATDAWRGVSVPCCNQVGVLSQYLAIQGSSESLRRQFPHRSSQAVGWPTRVLPGHSLPKAVVVGHISFPFLRARGGSEGSGS